MKFSFIAITASSNNLSTAKLLQLAICVVEENDCLATFNSYIKPIPRLSNTEKSASPISNSHIKSAPPFCDVALQIIPLLENSHPVFEDNFSQRLFIKTFKEIGYPIGKSKYIIKQLYKDVVGNKTSFSLTAAMETLGLENECFSLQQSCTAMADIFWALQQTKAPVTSYAEEPDSYNNKQPSFNRLPSTPGVYFFRNKANEIIYVGKAINISKRVRSHFSDSSLFERQLCAQTTSVDFEETGSETIALLLESHYITTLKPALNSSQINILDPYIITSKMDGKGIMRLQIIQKTYSDSENEFYYNRESVLAKMVQVQQKFNLCKRFAGIERTASQCSDPIFCKGICKGLEDKSIYNLRVAAAIKYIFDERPSYCIKLKGRHNFESAVILILNGIYQGFGFIDNDVQINSLEDIGGYINKYAHNYFSNRILDQFHKGNRKTDNIISFT